MYKILIAEDEALIRTGIISSIRWEDDGMTVAASCADGMSAWDKYLEVRPDIVLTDLRMPGLSGQELIARIREVSDTCRIIVITCLEDFDVVRSIIDKDLTAYLVKSSIAPSDILAAVRRAARQLKARGSALPAGSVDDAISDFLIKRTIDAEGFERTMRRMLPSFSGFGSFILTDKLTDEAAAGIKASFSILGEYYTLGYGSRTLIVFTSSFDSSILQSCLEPLRASGMRTVCRSMPTPSADMPAAIDKADNVLSEAYFYPADYYDLTGSRAFQPLYASESLSALCAHPVIRGLIESGSSDVRVAVSVLNTSFGANDYVFRSALYDLAYALSVHYDIDAERLRETGASALSSCRYLLGILPPRESSAVYDDVIDKAILYSAGHYTDPQIKLTDAAASCGFSASYFALLFRQGTGLNFTEYISLLRMDAACRLLSETNRTIDDIAASCGFSSTSYFTRCFSQRMDDPPKKWRKEHKI